MKFSEKTISILKNFSVINKSFAFREGKRQRCMSPLAEIFAEATIEEEIPFDVGVSDLTKLLATLSLYKDYDIEFQEKNFLIKSNVDNNSTVYYYDQIGTLKGVPDGKAKIKFPDDVIELSLKQHVFKNVLKAANTLHLEDLAFKSDGEKVYLEALKADASDKNVHSYEIGQCQEKFKLVTSIKNMNMLELDYKVHLSKANKLKFITEDGTLYYILSISEKKSSRG